MKLRSFKDYFYLLNKYIKWRFFVLKIASTVKHMWSNIQKSERGNDGQMWVEKLPGNLMQHEKKKKCIKGEERSKELEHDNNCAQFSLRNEQKKKVGNLFYFIKLIVFICSFLTEHIFIWLGFFVRCCI